MGMGTPSRWFVPPCGTSKVAPLIRTPASFYYKDQKLEATNDS